MEVDRHIEEIIENFDFAKVKKAMKCLGWKWRGETVTKKMLKQKAVELLREAANKRRMCGIGGLQARYVDDKDPYLELRFVVESWESEDV